MSRCSRCSPSGVHPDAHALRLPPRIGCAERAVRCPGADGLQGEGGHDTPLDCRDHPEPRDPRDAGRLRYDLQAERTALAEHFLGGARPVQRAPVDLHGLACETQHPANVRRQRERLRFRNGKQDLQAGGGQHELRFGGAQPESRHGFPTLPQFRIRHRQRRHLSDHRPPEGIRDAGFRKGRAADNHLQEIQPAHLSPDQLRLHNAGVAFRR